MTKSQRPNSIELDTYGAQSEPQTPEKHITFRHGYQRYPDRLNSLGDNGHRGHGRRKRSVRSVYLRDGEVHSVWKPKKVQPVTNPITTPTLPPSNFADVVHEVMRQHGKLNLRERQRQLLSRVTATQAVLKEQNEELAAGAGMTDEEDDEEKKEGVGERTAASTGGNRETPSKKMWQHAIKTVIDENKNDDEKTKKRIRKKSTVRFHEVVTNKVATMDNVGSRGLPSISEQPAPQTPNVKRKLSLSRKRQETTTPSGAIPFTEWKNQFYERQRMTRHGMKPFKSDYNLKAQAGRQYSGMLPRINSDNNLTFPADRRASAASVEDLEPRSKSVSQYHRMHMRRQSSPPGMLSYEDGGDISDTSSVALDDMFSPLSSRSVSPAVFSDEEERQSKLQSRTPVQTKAHQPLMKLDSEETRILSHPSNIDKRTRNHHLPRYQDTTHTGDDIIEIESGIDQSDQPMTNAPPPAATPTNKRRKRPKKVSISLPSSPRGTPSPRPPTPKSIFTNSRAASPSVETPQQRARRESILAFSSTFSDRITREQTRRRESVPHLPKFIEEEVATPDANNYSHPPLVSTNRRSSTPNILSSDTNTPKTRNPNERGREILIPSPPPT